MYKSKLASYFTSGSERSLRIKKNVLAMLFIKGGIILLNLLLVPLTLNYVDNETYGLWLTLSSMIAWMSFFDIGINNGLKNKLAEALALGDYNLGKKYVSTTYAIISLIFIPLMIIGLIICPLLDWQSILNIEVDKVNGLLTAILIIIAYFGIQFILSTINIVLLADQRPADSSFRTLLQHLVSVIIIWILTQTTNGNLVNLCLALCTSPIIVLLLFNLTLFSGRYKRISPSLNFVDFSVAPALMKLGLQFFIIQIAAIIQFQLINFIILHYYGATEVTAYNIAHKYFNIVYMVWGILLTPLWAASTDAITKGDNGWIRNAAKRYLKILFLLMIISGLMLFAAPTAYDLWIGDKVSISFGLSLWNMIYFLVLMFGGIYVSILNGVGLLRVQTIASLISPVVFLVVCYALIQYGYAVYSVLVAAVASNFNAYLLAPVQFYKYFNSLSSFRYENTLDYKHNNA